MRTFASYIIILWYCNLDVFQRNGNKIEETIPAKQAKLVGAWILLHTEGLNPLWNLMKNGEDYFKIELLYEDSIPKN